MNKDNLKQPSPQNFEKNKFLSRVTSDCNVNIEKKKIISKDKITKVKSSA